MYIRSYSWGRGDLSWSRVQERLLFAAQKLGHDPVFISTNGYENMQYWDEKKSNAVRERHKAEMGDAPYDIDITYTIPFNFKQRFLYDSKVKIGRFDYESSDLPKELSRHLNDCDYLVGSSDFVLDVFAKAGAKPEKLRKIHSGVDLDIFNTTGAVADRAKFGISANTHVFLAVAEPHYRKQLDRLLDIYHSRFTAKDDVILIIKTKLVDPVKKQGFEQDLKPVLAAIMAKYGESRPKLKIIPGHIASLAELYRMANTFVLPTAGEGWGMPFLEAMACGNVVIAPEYGGQLEFLTKENSLLCPIQIRPALMQEQYCAGVQAVGDAAFLHVPKGVVAPPKEDVFGDMMVDVFKNYSTIKQRLSPAMEETAKKFTWEAAAQQMLTIGGWK